MWDFFCKRRTNNTQTSRTEGKNGIYKTPCTLLFIDRTWNRNVCTQTLPKDTSSAQTHFTIKGHLMNGLYLNMRREWGHFLKHEKQTREGTALQQDRQNQNVYGKENPASLIFHALCSIPSIIDKDPFRMQIWAVFRQLILSLSASTQARFITANDYLWAILFT